jgi:hypothetical protein
MAMFFIDLMFICLIVCCFRLRDFDFAQSDKIVEIPFFIGITNSNKNVFLKTRALALMGAASPDLEKQGFLAVVFVNREYSRQQEIAPYNNVY